MTLTRTPRVPRERSIKPYPIHPHARIPVPRVRSAAPTRRDLFHAPWHHPGVRARLPARRGWAGDPGRPRHTGCAIPCCQR
jgi:hypothetical protein